MANKITKEFLQEYFRKHDSITLYKADDTPAVFSKQHHIRLYGGHRDIVFKDLDEFLTFCKSSAFVRNRFLSALIKTPVRLPHDPEGRSIFL